MKKQERGITIIALVVIALIAIMIIIIMVNTFKKNGQEEVNEVQGTAQEEGYVQTLIDGSKLNKSKELLKDKRLGELEISNIQLKETGGITTILADVKNNTNHEIQEKDITIEVLDRQGNIITNLNGTIDTVYAGEKVQLNMSVTGDVTNAYDFRIKE